MVQNKKNLNEQVADVMSSAMKVCTVIVGIGIREKDADDFPLALFVVYELLILHSRID